MGLLFEIIIESEAEAQALALMLMMNEVICMSVVLFVECCICEVLLSSSAMNYGNQLFVRLIL